MVTEAPREPAPPLSLHVVCRGNRGRSPLVAALLGQGLADRDPELPEIQIVSSGLRAARGLPMLPVALKVAAAHGVDLSTAESARTDLGNRGRVWAIITFETGLKKALSELAPGLVGRTFLLREIVRLSSAPSWDPSWNGTMEVVRRLDAARPFVDAGDDETPDPAALRRRAARRSLSAAVEDTERVRRVLFGPARRHSSPAP